MTRHGRTGLLLLALLALATIAVTATARKGNHYPPGCLRQADINIGYYPYVLAHASAIRVAPRDDAAQIRVLEAGRRFGVQSVQNPNRLADPGMPAPTNGYVWGYSRKGGRSAWVRADALVPDAGGWADGPSHEDFQAGGVMVPRLRRAPRFTLGYRVAGPVSVTEQTAYLRWAPNGAARGIVWRGEPLRLLWRASGHVCVEDAVGLRGWVNVDFTSAG